MSDLTKPSTHGERRVGGQAATAILDELDMVCKDRDETIGRVGNLQGKFNIAQGNLVREQELARQLEARAAKIRRAFEIYSGRREEDPTP